MSDERSPDRQIQHTAALSAMVALLAVKLDAAGSLVALEFAQDLRRTADVAEANSPTEFKDDERFDVAIMRSTAGMIEKQLPPSAPASNASIIPGSPDAVDA